MRKINPLNVFILLFICVNFTHAQNSKIEQKKKIVGTVIAQYSMNALLCVYHPCAVWLLVRLEAKKVQKPSYVRVTIEYFPGGNLPNKGFPSELVDRAKKWKFKAIRDSSQDSKVERYLNITNSETKKDVSEETAAPAWQLLLGAKDEKIPFDKVLPYYFVKSGDYKEIRE